MCLDLAHFQLYSITEECIKKTDEKNQVKKKKKKGNQGINRDFQGKQISSKNRILERGKNNMNLKQG